MINNAGFGVSDYFDVIDRKANAAMLQVMAGSQTDLTPLLLTAIKGIWCGGMYRLLAEVWIMDPEEFTEIGYRVYE